MKRQAKKRGSRRKRKGFKKRTTKKGAKKPDPMWEGWNDNPALRDAWSAGFESDESP